jgi:hypothetical protein
MTARLGIRDGAISAVIFAAVMFALISVDPRVKDRMTDLWGSGGVTPWADRIGELLSALWAAARTQSIENAPVVVFVTVGAVLTIFMLKS